MPWSVWITRGRPNIENNFVKALTRELAVTFVGKMSGSAHNCKQYWLPLLVLCKGPTQSIITHSNDSPVTWMGCNGVGGVVWFGLPASWQTWQLQQYFVTFDFKCPDHWLLCATNLNLVDLSYQPLCAEGYPILPAQAELCHGQCHCPWENVPNRQLETDSNREEASN